MKKRLLLFALISCLLTPCRDLLATPIPGSTNEIQNGDFENGYMEQPPPNWEVDNTNVVISGHVGNPGQSAMCYLYLDPGVWGNQMRQVVDETLNPLWDPVLHNKIIDLQVDILGGSQQGGGIRFRLDLWGEEYNGEDNPNNLPMPTAYTNWVEYPDPAEVWTTVNPFNQLLLGYQPRWVSVEIQFLQPLGTITYTTNVILSPQCDPQPATMTLLRLGGLTLFRRRRCS